MKSLILLIFAILDAHLTVHALKIPFKARTVSAETHRRLRSRAQITGQIVNTSNGSVAVNNNQNTVYFADITLGGETVPVLLDTGSSDLWVAESVPNAKSSGKSASLTYALGSASGNIEYADLTFDNYSVSSQAFLLVNNAESFSTNISSQGYNGLLGLGPNSGSIIRKTVGDDSADSTLDRIFSQNKTSQNYISFLLDRTNAPEDGITGQLTISELVAGFENITNEPQLPVNTLLDITDEDQHFQVLADKNEGIIGPDGEVIEVDSIVPSAPSGQLVMVFDSGFTFPQVPRSVSDAIYGRVKNAVYNTDQQYWTIPCYQYLNISFNFGGKNFPIHPLDTSSSDFDLPTVNGTRMCVGTFQPISTAFSLLGEYDVILGMGFLRNTYTLLDFGDFVDSSSNDRGAPFVQLLSTTDSNQAKQDFINARLGGQDTTGGSSQVLLPASEGQTSPETDEEKKQHLEEEILSRWPYILLGGLVLLALIIGLCIWRCCVRRRRAKTKATALPLTAMKNRYRPLDEPAPPPVLTNDFPQAHMAAPPPYIPQERYNDPYSDSYRR